MGFLTTCLIVCYFVVATCGISPSVTNTAMNTALSRVAMGEVWMELKHPKNLSTVRGNFVTVSVMMNAPPGNDVQDALETGPIYYLCVDIDDGSKRKCLDLRTSPTPTFRIENGLHTIQAYLSVSETGATRLGMGSTSKIFVVSDDEVLSDNTIHPPISCKDEICNSDESTNFHEPAQVPFFVQHGRRSVFPGASDNITIQKKKLLRGLYLGWLGKYNVGDDAMYLVAQELLALEGLSRGVAVTLIPFHPPQRCNNMKLSLSLNSYDFVIHGGGSILSRKEFTCALFNTHKSNIPVMMFGTGWSDPEGWLSPLVEENNTLTTKNDISGRYNAHEEYFYGKYTGKDQVVLSKMRLEISMYRNPLFSTHIDANAVKPLGAEDVVVTPLEIAGETELMGLQYLASLAQYGGPRGPYTAAIIATSNKYSKRKNKQKLSPIGDSGLLAGLLLGRSFNIHNKSTTVKSRFSQNVNYAFIHNLLHKQKSLEATRHRHEVLSTLYRSPLPNDRPIIAVNIGQNDPDPAIYHTDGTKLEQAFAATVAQLVSGMFTMISNVHASSEIQLPKFTVLLYGLSGTDLGSTRRVFLCARQMLDRIQQINMSKTHSSESNSIDYNLVDVLKEPCENIKEKFVSNFETMPHHSFLGKDMPNITAQGHLHWLPFNPDTQGILSLLGASDISLNYKLHGNVLSAAAGTPFVGVAYHIKTLEFADSLSMSRFILRSDTVQQGDWPGGSNMGNWLLVHVINKLWENRVVVHDNIVEGVLRATVKYQRELSELFEDIIH